LDYPISALGGAATIIEHPGGPALVRLRATVAKEGAIEQHDRAGLAGPGRHKPDVVSVDRTAVEQDLTCVRSKFRRPGRALMASLAIHRHPRQRDALAADGDAVHGFIAHDIAHPAVLTAQAQGGEMGFRMADRLRRTFNVQMFDAGLRDS